MTCKKCGREIDKTTEICIACGTDNHDYTIDWIKEVTNVSGMI